MAWDKNKFTGLIGLAVSLIYVILSINIMQPPGLTQDLLGSRAFPIAIGVLLGICSVGVFFMRVSSEEEEPLGAQGFKSLLPYLLFVIVFIVIFDYLGAFLSTVLFMFAVMNRMSKGKWWKDLLITVAISGGLWVLFTMVLTVPLP